MATFYLDMYGGGNDANDGTTPSTPKATLNAATALVTAVTDEIRVRGVDSLFTSLGNAKWTDGSVNVIMTGDTTTSVAVNDYICKTIVASGTTMPQLWRVASRTYAAGTNLTTIVLTNTTNCYYYGTTETVDTSKINVTQTIALQTFGRNGKTSGTANSWTRVDTLITGGWNSGYTTQNSFTLCFNIANASNYSVICNESTTRQYWHLQRFIVFNANQYYADRNRYSHMTDCCFIGYRNIATIDSPEFSVYNNCYFYHNATSNNFWNNNSNNSYTNCNFRIVTAKNTQYSNAGYYENCTLTYGNGYFFDNTKNSTFKNCFFRFRGTTFTIGTGTNVTNNKFYDCTWDLLNSNNVYLGALTTDLTGCTYTNTTGNFLSNGKIDNSTFTMTTGSFTNTGNVTNTDITTTTGAISITYASYDGTTNNLVTTSGALIINASTSLSNLTYSNTTGAITINSPSIINCNITNTTGAWSFTNTTQTIASGSTFVHTTGTVAFTSPIVSGIDLSGTTYTLTHNSATVVEKFIGNIIKASTSVTFNNENTPVLQQQSIVSGNTFTNGLLNTAKGLFIDNTGLDLATSAQLYGGTIIYDSNNDIDKTKFARIADNLSVPYIYQPQNTAWLQTPSGNTIFYNGGFVDLTSDVYTGKTTGSTSGTSALRLYNGLNHATNSVFRTVDFNVQANATGTTKFWAKGGTAFTLEYNFMNSANELIWSTWKTASLTTNYQEFTQAIAAGDIDYSGTMTLWFRIPSQAKGTYALIDYIQLT